MQIERYTDAHREAVVDLSLRAWAPVFVSMEQVFEPALYQEWYPDGWRIAQQKSVEETCGAPDANAWVATESGKVTGFTVVKLHSATYGEIYMIAVDPDFQRRGIALKLTTFALDWMKGQGVTIAMVETGGDPGHGPARQTYEKAGFGLFPVARYFKKL
jgi:GNAT superfamily N-acetyltransferase